MLAVVALALALPAVAAEAPGSKTASDGPGRAIVGYEVDTRRASVTRCGRSPPAQTSITRHVGVTTVHLDVRPVNLLPPHCDEPGSGRIGAAYRGMSPALTRFQTRVVVTHTRLWMRLPAARFSFSVIALGALGVAGCNDFGLVGEPGGEGAPTAVLIIDATAGQAPFDVIFDASNSTPFRDGDALTFEFDAGTGTFAAGQDEPTFAFTYEEGGSFEARVRVRGPDGRFE
jgi:hypothetical protein